MMIVLFNSLAPTVEKWPAGPNFGRPYLLKFWVFLAGKKCNELGKKCSIQLNLHKSHKWLLLKVRFSSVWSFSANHVSNNQSEQIINNNNCICILMIDEQLVEGRWGSGFLLQQSRSQVEENAISFWRTEVEPSPASTRNATSENLWIFPN